MANEIIDFAKRKKRICLLFKVDFAQSYDYVEWDFLEKASGYGIW